MSSLAPGDSPILFAPGWLGFTRDDVVELRDLRGGGSVRVEGRSAAWLLRHGTLDPTTQRLARYEPALGALDRSLAVAPLRALDRAGLLRGSGWGRLFLELTGQCNERCVHCYADSSPEVREALDAPTIERAIADAAAMGFESVQLTGGDPLLSPHCVGAAQTALRLGLPQVEIYTNGLALRGSLYAALRDLGVAFAFSIYSHSASRHDEVTQVPGSLERTAAAIRRAAADGLEVRVGIIDLGAAPTDLEATRAFVRGLGVEPNRVGVAALSPVGRGSDLRGDPSRSSGDAGFSGASSRGFVGRAAVAYDGTVYPCIFARHRPLGHLSTSSLRDVLEAPVPAPMRRTALPVVGPNESLECWECRLRCTAIGGGA